MIVVSIGDIISLVIGGLALVFLKTYKIGYCKGIDVGIEAFNDLKNKLKHGVKDFKESEGLQ